MAWQNGRYTSLRLLTSTLTHFLGARRVVGCLEKEGGEHKTASLLSGERYHFAAEAGWLGKERGNLDGRIERVHSARPVLPQTLGYYCVELPCS